MSQNIPVPGPSQDAFETLSDQVTTLNSKMIQYSGLWNSGKNCNDMPVNSIGICWASATNSPGFVGIIVCAGEGTDKRQFAIPTENADGYKIKSRRYENSTWTNWRNLT